MSRTTQKISSIYIEDVIFEFFKVIPFTTLFLILVIAIWNREILYDLIESGSDYMRVSQTVFVALCFLFLITFVIVCALILRLVKYICDEREKYRKDKELHARERKALIALFEATGGNEWKNKTKWCSNSPVHEWKGVFKNKYHGHVFKLILSENNMKGQIPGEIFLDLPYLIEIDFRDNNISGPIPKEIAKLQQLQGLYLYSNRFTSKIPDELADLPHLCGIYLYNNNLEDIERSKILFNEKLKKQDPDSIIFI